MGPSFQPLSAPVPSSPGRRHKASSEAPEIGALSRRCTTGPTPSGTPGPLPAAGPRFFLLRPAASGVQAEWTTNEGTRCTTSQFIDVLSQHVLSCSERQRKKDLGNVHSLAYVAIGERGRHGQEKYHPISSTNHVDVPRGRPMLSASGSIHPCTPKQGTTVTMGPHRPATP